MVFKRKNKAKRVSFLAMPFTSSNSGSACGGFSRSGSITRHSLGSGMPLAGLFLVSAAATITRLISLFASFRFSRNVEMLIDSGSRGFAQPLANLLEEGHRVQL